MTPRRPAFVAAAAILLVAAAAGCINLDVRPLGNQAAVAIGPESIVTPLNEPGLGRAGAVVRGQVRRAGHLEPWPMLSLDGLGLIVEDRAGVGPMLVWSDWQSGERVELAGVTGAQFISSRHFIAEADGRPALVSLDAPGDFLPVDPAIDPRLARALPEHELWAAIVDGNLLIGDLAGGIATDSASRFNLGARARQLAVFEREAIALVELRGGMVEVYDLLGRTSLDLLLHGAIDWPYVPLTPLSLHDTFPLPVAGVGLISADAHNVVSISPDRRIEVQAAPRVEFSDEGGSPGAVVSGRPTLLNSPDWRGIVWPPAPLTWWQSAASAATGQPPPHLAFTPWPREGAGD